MTQANSPGYPSEYLLVITDPTASMTEEETKFSDGMSSRPCFVLVFVD